MNIKRMRGRGHRGTGGGGGGGGGGPIRHSSGGGVPLNRNHVFDSSGPDLRIRGTAQQLFEKYLQLGRDATSSGDRVMGEGYFQHAEHYFRIVSAINLQTQQQQGQPVQNGYQNGQPRRQANGEEQQPTDEQDENGSDEQQTGENREALVESREIPIAAAAPDA
jgi:hypothetical protein